MKRMGYRYVINSVTLPASLARGAAFTLEAHWANVNVAPTYLPWRVVWQLRDANTRTIAWEGTSQLDLRSVLPTTDFAVSDSFGLPSDVPAGEYDLLVSVRDMDNYSDPLALAIQGSQGNGSYWIGSIGVT